MKAKKALKRLNKVEALLTNVMDQFPGNKAGLAVLLDSAKSAVVHAQKTVSSQIRKPAASAKTARQGRVTPEGTTSVAAEKRSGARKRTGGNTRTSGRLSKAAHQS